jgi:hypothetical protein
MNRRERFLESDDCLGDCSLLEFVGVAVVVTALGGLFLYAVTAALVGLGF